MSLCMRGFLEKTREDVTLIPVTAFVGTRWRAGEQRIGARGERLAACGAGGGDQHDGRGERGRRIGACC